MDNNNNNNDDNAVAGRHRRLLRLHRQQFYKNSSNSSNSSNISLSICIQETTYCSRNNSNSNINTNNNNNNNNSMSSGNKPKTSATGASNTSTNTSSSNNMDQTRLRIEQMEADRVQRRRDMQQRKLERVQQQQANIAAGNPGDVDFIGMISTWRKENVHLMEPHHHHHYHHHDNIHDNNNNNNIHDIYDNDTEEEQQSQQQSPPPPPPPLCVIVRKRGLSDKEQRSKNTDNFDSVTCFNPNVTIHSAKFKVDGITKYMHHNTFRLDHAFDEHATTEQIYQYTVRPLLNFVVCCNTNNNNTTTRHLSGINNNNNNNNKTGNGGCGGNGNGGARATVFCYGQTGSGKTYTMNGIQQCVSRDLFHLLSTNTNSNNNDDNDDSCCYCTLENTRVMVSFFELYGGNVHDLLQDDRQRLKILEDAHGEICVTGLSQVEAVSAEELQSIFIRGMASRTTHQTEANDSSSRSHAICQILLQARQENTNTATATNNNNNTAPVSSSRRGGGDNNNKKNASSGGGGPQLLRGKLSLVDLAGSESSVDTKSHNAQRRAESSDINTSLLALKECIRALDRNKQQQQNSSNNNSNNNNNNKHVPYRGSKLTLLLKDCFTSPHAISTMIATVSPGASATDHSLNTLRYADRIKEQRVMHNKNKQQQQQPSSYSAGSSGGGGALLKNIPIQQHGNKNTQSLTTSSSPKRATSSILPPTTPTATTKRASNMPTTQTRGGSSFATVAVTSTTTNRRITTKTAAAVPSSTAANSKSIKSTCTSSGSIDHPGGSTTTRTGNVPTTPSPKRATLASAPSEEEEFYTADEADNDDDDDDYSADTVDSCLSDPDQMNESMQAIYDQECEILSLHMQNIQENADLLTQEGKMLKDIQQKISLENINGTDYQDMDDYVEALASILDRKEDMIGLIQDKVMEFNQQQQQLLLLSQSKEEPDLDNCHDKVGGSGSAPGSLSLLMVSTSASADTPANDNHVVDTGPMLGGDGGHASPSSKTASIKV